MRLLYFPDQYAQQRQHEKKRWIYPVRLAMEATFYRDLGFHVEWAPPGEYFECHREHFDRVITKPEGIPFLDLPAPDPILTMAKHPNYQKNGNFKYNPGTYTLAASGCWYGKCTFCVERNKYCEVRSVESVLEEIRQLELLGFKEVFDDSATFPDGGWLFDFCMLKIALGIKTPISCNMRIGADVNFELMKAAGFRMLLFGIESANQKTLDKINKGVKYEEISPYLQQAKKAGLDVHIAVMFGYPWEGDQDARKSIMLVHNLLRAGYATTAQASYFCSVGQESNEETRKYIEMIYDVWKSPRFWYNKIRAIRGWHDIRYLFKQIKSGLGRGK